MDISSVVCTAVSAVRVSSTVKQRRPCGCFETFLSAHKRDRTPPDGEGDAARVPDESFSRHTFVIVGCDQRASDALF
jgi:hypothetical protein